MSATENNTLASIVHELNNPLTTILGLSDLMLHDEVAADTRVKRIHAEAERSVQIIRNILNLCRPNTATNSDGRAFVDVNEAIRHGAALVEDQIELHGIELVMELPWRAPRVWSRPGELTQVFLNLITNAIQAIGSTARPGAITIMGTQLGNRVCITVEDDGPGFGDEDPQRSFEPFFTTKKAGTGIGLDLSRKIVRSAGGEIWASRNPDRGAVFTIELPVAENEENVF